MRIKMILLLLQMAPEFWILSGMTGITAVAIFTPVSAGGEAGAWARYGQGQFIIGMMKLMAIVSAEWALRSLVLPIMV